MPFYPVPDGRTAAEFPLAISGGGSVPAHLLQRRDPYAEAIKTIAPVIQQYLAQKRADEIANRYLNQVNPPRAEAVDPTLYNPDLAFDQGLESEINPAATRPATGGQQAYKADVLYRKFLEDQQGQKLKADSAYWQNEVRKAQAERYRREPEVTVNGVPKSPVVDEQTRLIWNGRQWVKPPKSGRLNDGEELPPGVTKEAFRNSRKPKPYDPAQAFRDWQAENQDVTSWDRPSTPGAEIYQARIPNAQPEPAPNQQAQTEAKAQEIRDAYRNGKLTREQAKKQLWELGFE